MCIIWIGKYEADWVNLIKFLTRARNNEHVHINKGSEIYIKFSLFIWCGKEL